MVEATTGDVVAQARQILEDCGHQEELVKDLAERTGDKQQELAEQIVRLNKVTPTGMKAYLERARKLLADSANNVNPFDSFKPSVPGGVFLRPGESEFDEMEAAGMGELSKVCFVLIAGGLGERLGYSGIKVSLPVVTIEEDYSYLKYYSQYALACQAAARKQDPSLPADFYVPLGIMVSDDTHDRTVALLEQNGYFGLAKE
jgi:UDP-sugar pyrophosphorylase